MNQVQVVVLMGLFLIGLILLFFVVRLFTAVHRRQRERGTDGASQVGFVVDTFHDLVSRLKEKERELEQLKRDAEERASSVERYTEDIFQSVPSGLVSFDETLTVTKINASAAKILELEESAIVGRGHAEIFKSPIAEMLEQRKTVERGESGYLTHSGKRIWLGLTISPLKDSANTVIGQLLVFTDLTELKAFQAQMELRERLSNLGEMSAGIAHELRNPMAVISGYTKILSKKADKTLLPAVDAIRREVSVMDRIIRDFLSFAKPEELVFSPVDLQGLIRGCIASIADQTEKISIRMEIDSLPSIRADEVLLRQAFTNLLQNAVEAMPEGGTLSVRGGAADCLTVSIGDTGHGIPENLKERIFLPFYTTKERGTGLGLPIVHKIVVSHGGSITVETDDRGTAFVLNLPITLVVG